jgi:hypothetical protein
MGVDMKSARDKSMSRLKALHIPDSEAFWRLCMTFKITGFMDFDHVPEF